MTRLSFKSKKWLLIGFTLTTLLLFTALSPQAELKSKDTEKAAVTPAHVAPLAVQTPTPAPQWNQPTRPNTKYVCDYWKRPRANGMAEVNFEYTRQLPNGGWLGRLNTKYPDGRTRVDNMQLFAAKPIPRGKEWRFQTTNGKITCKMGVTRGSTEVRFGGCNNGVEQYCVDQRLMDSVNAFPDQPCGECRGRGVFDRVGCLTRCFNLMAGRPVNFDCPNDSNPDAMTRSPVACMVTTNMMAIVRHIEAGGGGADHIRAFITEYGLLEMQQNWIDFVNKELGPCTSSVFCPMGSSCDGGQCVDWTKLVK